MENETETQVNIEDVMGNFLSGESGVGGDEELLKVASQYALVLKGKQIKVLLWLKVKIELYKLGNEMEKKRAVVLETYVKQYIEWKSYHNAQNFIMRALDNISLRRFINENSLKVNIDKST